MASLVGLARAGASALQRGYDGHRRAFQEIARRARGRFATRDWAGGQADARARLELYRMSIEGVVDELARVLEWNLDEPAVWRQMRSFFAEGIAEYHDHELAETFFNSVTRKVLVTVGVDFGIEFIDLDLRRDRYGHVSSAHRSYRRTSTLAALVARALSDFDLGVPFEDLDADVERVAAELGAAWQRGGRPGEIDGLDLYGSPFYRGTGAYLVGRLRGSAASTPLVIVLRHGERGVYADAVLTTEREVSVVFSYTRSHFLVEAPRPADLIRFLASILPRKPIADLYISVGFVKHGKTELYRDLIGHLRRSMDSFVHAPGDKGMVMIVFGQPSHDYVFKVIRDKFAPPKSTTREKVLERYQLVFRHDRAGRMIEAQEFEHLTFAKSRFSPELLEELLGSAADTVTETVAEDDQGKKTELVHIRHLYIERRVRPLNLFLREAPEEDARRAVLDYGQALRDLASTNIFPGDLLLKNFGVTGNGRVTFYDYDELCLVTDCRFRELPGARTDAEELSAEPWFYVDPSDVFPEEFLNFMGLNKVLREVLLSEHAEVLTAAFWREIQARHEAGGVIDVFPYPP